MSSEELRQDILKFLAENGIKKGIVSKQTGLSNSILSSWFSGRLNLKEDEMQIMLQYLKDKKKIY